MTYSFSQLTFSSLAAALLLNFSSAYAADYAGVTAERNPEARYEEAKINDLSIKVIAANHRETNLQKTAISIIVTGVEDRKIGRQHR